ncbi:maleylpyruvate isomerase family mycothiol-dependent enzyme [Nonomuraea sp. NPDC050790]|uniref:maleylpyruvate isomerase family mycothiol-dependent enzyme n=1 Tax=Nonomuraea sp. NPDC050790 TaxID=3364371 RepID=UPI003795F937
MTDVQAAIAAERRDLATLLAGLTPEQWRAPSLCAGWRVREVAAHLTMAFRYSMPRVVLSILRARGDFNRAADRLARRDAAAMDTGRLVAALSANAEHPWTPPGGGLAEALRHDVIHGLDITLPLGLGRKVPPDRLVLAMPADLTAKSITFFGARLDGVRFTADDLDWSAGTGELVTGSAQDLLLAVTGRKLPPGHLSGPAAPHFTTP